MGAGVAVALTLIAADATVYGIAAWKIVLAVIGLLLMAAGGPLRGKPEVTVSGRRLPNDDAD